MISDQQIQQILQSLRQKNNAGDGVVANSPLPANAIMPQYGQQPQGQQQQAPSVLGFLGGLGDSKNANGGVDPSMLSRWNQGIMGFTGQSNGQQPFPWQQQPSGQQLGQDVSSAGHGALTKILSMFL